MDRFVSALAVVGAVVFLQVGCGRSPQSDLERGNQLAAAGKYADAELLYRRSLSKDPKLAESYYRLGVLEYRLGRGMQALQDIQRAAELQPANERYAVDLASTAIQAYQVLPGNQNLYEQAAREADSLLNKDPKSFDGLRLQGDVRVIDRKFDDALLDFQKANAIRPNDPNVVPAMTRILFSQNRDREAEVLAWQFLQARKDFPPMYDALEAYYIRNKRLADAESLLRSEIEALPADAHPRLQLAGLYQGSGRGREMSGELARITGDRTHFPMGTAQVGDFYADRKEWDLALAQYRDGLRQSSDSNKILYHKRIERSLEALGKPREALAELNEALKINPQDPEVRLARALLLAASQDTNERDSANEELKALAAQYPRNDVVHYNLALSYLGKGKTALAWQESKKSAGLRKDYVLPRLLMAEIAQGAHNYTVAREAAEEALALDANNFNAQLLHAAALIGSKSYRQAENELKALSKQQPKSKEVDLELAALAGGQKDYAKAEDLYRRLYHPGSSDLRPLQGLLELCVLEHRPDKAQALLEVDLRQQPDSRPIRMLLASVATEQGKYDIASQQYRWLQSKDPQSAQAYASLGYLFQLQGANNEALASYQKAAALAPKDPKILNSLAIMESNSGLAHQAIQTLNQQLAIDPDNPTAMNNLAFNLAETGTDLDRALNLAEKVARKFPSDPGVVDTLGWVYAKRGLNESAIQVLRGLVQKYPKEPAYRYHLAVAYSQGKQSSDAKRELLAALSEHPAQPLSSKIQENLARIQ